MLTNIICHIDDLALQRIAPNGGFIFFISDSNCVLKWYIFNQNTSHSLRVYHAAYVVRCNVGYNAKTIWHKTWSDANHLFGECEHHMHKVRLICIIKSHTIAAQATSTRPTPCEAILTHVVDKGLGSIRQCHMYTHIYIYTYIYTCLHICLVHVCKHKYMHVFMYSYHTHNWIYVYVCTHSLQILPLIRGNCSN